MSLRGILPMTMKGSWVAFRIAVDSSCFKNICKLRTFKWNLKKKKITLPSNLSKLNSKEHGKPFQTVINTSFLDQTVNTTLIKH